MNETFPIVPAPFRLSWLFVPAFLVTIGAATFVYLLVRTTGRYPEIPSSPLSPHTHVSWAMDRSPMIVGALLVVGLGIFAYSLSGARNARFSVTPEGLRLRGDFYGRLVPLPALRLASARVIDLRSEPEFAPVWRTMGTALPGYRAGWFRLRNHQRALLYVTDPSRVVYLPVAEGYIILLSVTTPDAFLESLRRAQALGI